MSENRTPAAPGEKPYVDFTAEAQDADHFMIFQSTGVEIPLPAVTIGDYTWQVTKFHVLLGIAAVITAAVLIWLGRKMRSGGPPRGVIQGMVESLVYFVRDVIARPAIDHTPEHGEGGHGRERHEGDQYVPFLTTTFLFILVGNLLGMIPFLGSPTASIAVTAALSLATFVYIHFWGIRENGAVGYFKSFIPHIDLDGPARVLLIFLVPLIMVLELMTPFIRAFVLAVRLFANMLAGHVAVFVLLFFIHMVSNHEWVAYHKGPEWLYYVVAPLSVAIVTALSMLELFVAGLQAFIFTLLVAIFLGLARHPAH